MKIQLLTFLFIFFASSIALGNECLEYGPAKVQLKGKINRSVYPGPPEYSNVAKGDHKEVMWFLSLERPICVKANAKDPTGFEVEEKNVTDLQMALTPEQYQEYKNLLGKSAMVSGELFHEHTAHHHTKVLIGVSKIE
ncbi:MAG: DUF4431 domain-containing protein [Deltaproteobacteria bacterium]|nr:DUF4431 domain-containing protein [Deltaproteobacteria bacterium]